MSLRHVSKFVGKGPSINLLKGDDMDKNIKNLLLIFTVVFLFMVGCSALFIATWDTFNGVAVPAGVTAMLTTGLTYAVTSLGISHGSSLTTQGVQEGVNLQPTK